MKLTEEQIEDIKNNSKVIIDNGIYISTKDSKQSDQDTYLWIFYCKEKETYIGIEYHIIYNFWEIVREELGDTYHFVKYNEDTKEWSIIDNPII